MFQVEAWDDFATRCEAVAKGTDAQQFGETFAQNLRALKWPPAQVATAFRDFSLFANPANLKLINWDAMRAVRLPGEYVQ